MDSISKKLDKVSRCLWAARGDYTDHYGIVMFKVGDKVKNLVEFVSVPVGTIGTVVEDYGSGFTIEWDFDYKQLKLLRPLRDGFNKEAELDLLEKIS